MMKRNRSQDKLPPNLSELRVVLLGGSWTQRNEIGNIILGKEAFLTREPHCLRGQTQLEGERVVVINTPDISDNLTENVEDCMRVSGPGPHVLLLLLHPQPLEAQRLQSILELFSDKAFRHSLLLVLVPNQELLSRMKIEHPKIGDLAEKCRNALPWHETLERTTLMLAVKNIFIENERCHLTYEPPSHHESIKAKEFPDTLDQAVELRIVLLGKSGRRKMKLRNVITETQDTTSSIEQCVATTAEWRGRLLTVVNTPNIFSLPEKVDWRLTVRNEIRKCIHLCSPGPNALLLLVKPSEFSTENKQQVEFILNLLGQNSVKYLMVMKTHKEIPKAPVKDLIEECGGRQYNMYDNDRTQLMKMIENMVHENNAESIYLKSPLNLVLCGRNEEKKIAVVRALLGQPQLPSVSDSPEFVKHQGKVCGRPVSLVHLPALNGKSEEAAMQESLKCISLYDPEGVHAFFLVLPVDPLTDDDKMESKIIQDILGSQGSDMTMPLFTTDSDPTHSAVVNFLKGNKDIRALCQSYGERYVLNINYKQQIPALLDKVDEMRTESKSSSYTTTTFAHAQMEKIIQQKELLAKQKKEFEEFRKTSVTCDNAIERSDCLRIVLIGKTGSGKSSSGNTILGKKKFKEETKQTSVTKSCQKERSEVDGRPIVIVDTPGLFDTSMSKGDVTKELVQCISLLSPGPHVFLLVLQIGRFTEEEMKTLELLQTIFGKNSETFTIVLFTRGDALQHDEKSFEEFIAGCEPYCKKLISDCAGRCHVFNNYDKNNRKQVSDLITIIDTMVKRNGGGCYTSEMFQEAEASIEREIEKILKEKEKEMQRVTEELQRKHKEEMKDMERKLQEKTAEAEQERKLKETQLEKMRKNIEKEHEERQKEKEQREEEDRKRKEQENLQRKEYQNNLADLERKIEAGKEEKQTTDRKLEQSQKEMRKQKEVWEKKQQEWWDKRAEDEEEARKKEREKLKKRQEEYEQELAEYEKKRKEDEQMRKEEQEKMKKELEENYRKEIEGLRKKYEEDARKQAEELNDFKLKYTKDFAALVDKHMEEMKEMKLRHGRQLQETEDRHDTEYKLLGDLSHHKEKNRKEELEDLKRKHEQEMKDLRDKYQSKCVIL